VSSPPIDHYAGTRDRDLFVFACLLEDGSNLFALIYPGGQRFVRTAHQIDWGIEERYEPPPRPRDLPRVNRLWRELVDEMVAAGKAADADMAALGLPSAAEQARSWRRRGDGGAT
jgi:hypothetical protein